LEDAVWEVVDLSERGFGVVVAKVYHTKERQRRRYDSQVLPDLEGQARADMQERNTRQGVL
jgi:hypothetical protein